eukprot:Pgem_evm1s566
MGLKWGDQILSINGTTVNEFSIPELYELLCHAKKVRILIAEHFALDVNVEREEHDKGMTGVWFNKEGTDIVKVCRSSPGFVAGLREGMTVVSINNKQVLGENQDDKVYHLLDQEWKKGSVSFQVMPSKQGKQLLQASKELLEESGMD